MTTGDRLGPYEVVGKLGEGGMGQVLLARDTKLDRQVAIKILPPAFAHDPDRLARFQREAKTLASLNHPHIAAIYGLEETPATGSGQPPITALVMELVEGEDLSQRIERGPLPIDEALAIAKQIAGALEAAHDQGIVHRDLKPANIKVRPDGTVKVLDFGLAKAVAGDAGSLIRTDGSMSPTITTPAMTQAGMILGTAAYMSPEQARGRPLDKRADVWAFGAVFYEMLTGHRAYAGDDVSDVMASVLAREPDWSKLPAALPPVVTMFLKRCLQKDPRQRLRDIGDLSLALSGAFDSAAPLAPAAMPIAPPLWRRALPVAAAAVASAVIVTAAAWRAWPTAPDPPLPTRFDYAIPDDQGVATATQRPVIALSDNGQVLVYQTRRGIQARAMGELAARTVTASAGAEPFLSPDGQWVAFFGEGPRGTAQLKKVPIGGGSAVTICEVPAFPLGASWAAADTILLGQPQGIMRVPASGGTPDLIVKAAEGETIYGPRLLPGANAVLFSVTTGSGSNRWTNARVAVQPLTSPTRTVVVEGASDPVWLPTGHLIYVAGTTLYGARFDPNHPAPVRGAVPLIEGIDRPAGVAAAGSNYAVSHDGTLIYLTGGSPRRSLVWVKRDGGAEEPITTIPPGTFEDPRLSPDGSRLLVTRDGDIWVYDIASGRSSRVTRDGTSFYGAWDPTATQIAYSSTTGGDIEAWLAPADGSGVPRQLTKLGGAVHVDSWSPDGRLLVMHQHGITNKIAILLLAMNDAGATPQKFADTATQAEGFRFSPDMGDAVYLSEETGQREIYIRPYPGPGGQVTVSVGGGQEPVWAKTGEVFYRSLPLAGNRMFAASVTTKPTLSVKAPVTVFDRSYFVAPSGSPRPQYDVTADGKRFLMISSGSASAERPRIIVVQHWFEELKRLVPPT